MCSTHVYRETEAIFMAVQVLMYITMYVPTLLSVCKFYFQFQQSQISVYMYSLIDIVMITRHLFIEM